MTIASFCLKNVEEGTTLYYVWMFGLALVMYFGIAPAVEQAVEGLVVTNMSDSAPWGLHIANFTFMIGVAAGGITVVMPAYVFHHKGMKDIVVIGELLPIVAIIMAVLCIFSDMGRPDRLLHVMPPFGMLNLPSSMLSFDVVVLNGYLGLNVFMVTYSLLKKYHHWPEGPFYRRVIVPTAFISIVWALTIHAVTAFIFSTLVARPYWNNPIAAPKFIATAVATGPAILIIVLQLIEKRFKFPVADDVYVLFSKIAFFSLAASLVMLVSEFVVELYTGSEHSIHARYLWLGYRGHNELLVFSWGSTLLNVLGLVGLYASGFGKNRGILTAAAMCITVGIWIEKGICFMFPAYVPNPIGEMVVYVPNGHEIMLVLAIWALGLFIFTILIKMAVPIMALTESPADRGRRFNNLEG